MGCIILHGCPDDEYDRTYNGHWIPWLKKKLNSYKINVQAPNMPKPWAPNYEAFKKEFEKYEIDKDSILVGHSCGCAFLVRYLGETKKKVAKLILVAPWKIPDETNVKKLFYNFEIDSSIKSRVKEILIFTSDDEALEGKKSVEIYREKLGGNIIELKGHGHYTLEDMETDEFPELLDQIKN